MAHIVLKIGGSSLATAEGFKQAAKVILANSKRRYVVVSAPGKRTPEDTKVTDLLLSLKTTEHPAETLHVIKERYLEIVRGLELGEEMVERIGTEIATIAAYLKKLSKGASFDYVPSRGEYMSGLILTKLLGWEFVDAALFIRFDEDGYYDPHATRRALIRAPLPERAVIPGFYGRDKKGRVRTFSRGGSDITGAIVAARTGADLYENATDVHGVFMANPKLVATPKVIDMMTYSEMQEMAYRGANVLHYEAIYPVKQAGIPTRVFGLNTPTADGTVVYPDGHQRTKSKKCFVGVAESPDFTMFTIKKPGMNADKEFTLKVLGVLAQHKASYDHITTGLDTLDLIVPDSALGKDTAARALARSAIVDGIKQACGAEVFVVTEIGVICVVGKDLSKDLTLVSNLLNCLSTRGTQPTFYEQGGCRTTLVIGVPAVILRETVALIYDFMFRYERK